MSEEGHGASAWGDENVSELDGSEVGVAQEIVEVPQSCCRMVHFKTLTCIWWRGTSFFKKWRNWNLNISNKRREPNGRSP